METSCFKESVDCSNCYRMRGGGFGETTGGFDLVAFARVACYEVLRSLLTVGLDLNLSRSD